MILSEDMWNYFCAKQAELDEAFMDNARWKPTLKDRETAFLVEKGEFVNEFVLELRWWKHKWNDRDRILDEFADTIHFITGISNTEGDGKPYVSYSVIASIYRHKSISWNVTALPSLLQQLIRCNDIHESFALALYILKASDFDEKDIKQAYEQKNAENFQRIAQGY